MMEYVQMTLNDWLSLKKEIAEEFARASASFVRIGYLLRKAEDSEGYKNDGYDTLAEWARNELGLSATYVSRFKAINAKYSAGGYSDHLRPEFIGYGSAKLGEMLALPDEDMQMVTPDMKRSDIRALKEFNREAPEAEGGEAWIRDMLKVTPDTVIAELAKAQELGMLDGKQCAEILNPGGNRMVRTKTAMIAMMDEGLVVKTFGPEGGRKTFSWQEFAGLLAEQKLKDPEKPAPAESAEKAEQEWKPQKAEGAVSPSDKSKTEDHKRYAEGTESAGEGTARLSERHPEAEGEQEAGLEKGQDPRHGNGHGSASAEESETIAPAQFSQEKEPEKEPETQEPDMPSIPEERMPEYLQALTNARGKLEEIEKSFEDSDWHRMSDLLISLGFIVNQLKVISSMTT